MGLDPTAPREEVDAALATDSAYGQNRVLNGMSFLFVEFFGHLLYAAVGSSVHAAGPALLRTNSLLQLKESPNLDPLVQATRAESVTEGDVLAVAWFAFCHIIDELWASSWRDSYLAARSRGRFNYSKETRERILKSLRDLDAYMRKSQLTKPWTICIPAQTGLVEYIRLSLEPPE
jgi:hypothetical protein